MRDTEEVLHAIDWKASETKLSVIVANRRGADDAAKQEMVTYMGFPFSISQEFQKRNTNKSIEEAVDVVEYIKKTSEAVAKQMVVYISMGFGNNYGEHWDEHLVAQWVERLAKFGIDSFSISDTVGVATPRNIERVFNLLLKEFPHIEFGAHFHTRADTWREKVDAAYSNGCMRFDGAVGGFGGCPMAEDDLVGNMPTERLLEYFDSKNVDLGLDRDAFQEARILSTEIFP
jgi:hydroxymethylglutaryl-CoA lyase